MKFYLASSFDLVERVKKVVAILRKDGHEITVEWWHRDYKQLPIQNDEEWYGHPKVREISERNFDGIRACDRFLFIGPSDRPTKFNGANVELGFAHALGKPCFSLGKLERSAMYVPVCRCDFIDEVLE